MLSDESAEQMPAILLIGILITLGFFLGLLAEKLKLPRIIAYIITGVIFSPDMLGDFLKISTDPWAPALTNIALGIIAYLVGAEIDLDDLRQERKIALSAVIGQSLGVLVLISAGIWVLNQLFGMFTQISLQHALILGAIATATAPATTLGIIAEYRAQGQLTNLLLGVVAIDDAIGIIFFTLILGAVGSGSLMTSLLTGGQEVAGALLTGGFGGVALGYLGRYVRAEALRLPVITGFILLTVGLSEFFNFSMLLSCMILGFVSTVFYPRGKAEWLLPMQHIEELVFMFFFILAGTHLEISVLSSSFGLIFTYIVLRTTGKYSGAWMGTRLSGADENVRTLLGLCLFPQAGVAIGLAIRASQHPGLEQTATLLINVIIGSTIVFELLSPLSTRLALQKAGDIKI